MRLIVVVLLCFGLSGCYASSHGWTKPIVHGLQPIFDRAIDGLWDYATVTFGKEPTCANPSSC